MADTRKGLKLGTTLYSLTTEFHSRQYSFEQLIRRVAKENLGPGLEVVGFQSIRGFPQISDDFAARFRDLIQETGLVPSCLAVNADVAINPDRLMDTAEIVAYHVPQLRAAAKLGFPVIRFQYPAGPEAIRQLVPLAEELGIRMGLEIHAPHHVQHPDVLAFREMYERVGSQVLGFIPDFGASSRRVPPSFIDFFRHYVRVPEEVIRLGLDIWESDIPPHSKRTEFFTRARAIGATEQQMVEMSPIFGLFSRQPPEAWAEIMPRVVHIHGKFFDFDENGDEVTVDYGRLLPTFVNGGFDGYMSSEYEGHHFTDSDGFDKLRRHHALCRRILATLVD